MTSKRCNRCRLEKPLTDFYTKDRFSKYASQRLQSACKQCYCVIRRKYRVNQVISDARNSRLDKVAPEATFEL